MNGQRNMRRATRVVLIAGLCACPHAANAFEDADVFSDPTAQGGGGKRYFTGSPADPYTCKVCHQHGAKPSAEVSGLPLSGYVPGRAYEITVDWSDDLQHVAAAVEITDMQGRRAGSVRLPGPSELKDPELCEEPIQRAARLMKVARDATSDACAQDDGDSPNDCRTVVHSTSCGAQRLRFLWRAPERDLGPLWFGGAIVSADGDGTPEADGVMALSSVMAGGKNTTRELAVSSGCSASRVRASASWPTLLLLLAAGWFCRSRKRQSV